MGTVGGRGLGLWGSVGFLLPHWEELLIDCTMVALVWGWLAWTKGQALQWISLLSVQYNKFTGAGAQQLAASLRKCPHMETLA